MGCKLFQDKNDFNRSGPSHLVEGVVWDNPHHRRSVTACLVYGTYTLERERSKAPLWWKSFDFKLTQELVDDEGNGFGAVFEYHGKDSTKGSPRYVIAFRGTIWKISSDLCMVSSLTKNAVRGSPRFQIAMEAVRDVIAKNDASKVWLTGHSMGAAIGLLAGKTMAKEGILLETFLFNPPYVSIPIKNKGVRKGVQWVSTKLKKRRNSNGNEGNSFGAISRWIPHLFVNRNDRICFRYIEYFEYRKKLEEKGDGATANLYSQQSLTFVIVDAVGVKGVETAEPLHLLPSAELIENLNPSRIGFKAHKLRQWWSSQLTLECRVYKYKDPAYWPVQPCADLESTRQNPAKANRSRVHDSSLLEPSV